MQALLESTSDKLLRILGAWAYWADTEDMQAGAKEWTKAEIRVLPAALTRLQGLGLIESRLGHRHIPSEMDAKTKRPKRYYAITRKGANALSPWQSR